MVFPEGQRFEREGGSIKLDAGLAVDIEKEFSDIGFIIFLSYTDIRNENALTFNRIGTFRVSSRAKEP